jgi:MoxR-like ATPase
MIVGQERVVETTLTTLVCGGNILLEGVPGLGKTELVKTLSKVIDLEFKRIQFTPDLMPADIIGTNILSNDERGTYTMEFRRGPIFTQLLLADEINRATPKTQSALLETMQEGSVTVDRVTYKLAPPFFVMATQNPLEQEGTYPLPEAQLDRFMFKSWVPYPDRNDLNEILNRTILKQIKTIEKVYSGEQIMKLREILDKVVVADPMRDYAVRIVLATHPDSQWATENVKRFVKWGGSPRATQALVMASRVRALTAGRVHVAFEDIRFFAEEALQHRLLLNYDGQAENIDPRTLIKEIIHSVPEDEKKAGAAA